MTKLQAGGPEVNPAEETIFVGPLGIRFLLTGENSSGSVATFEMTVPPTEGLPAPPHSHNSYEETLNSCLDSQSSEHALNMNDLESGHSHIHVQRDYKVERS